MTHRRNVRIFALLGAVILTLLPALLPRRARAASPDAAGYSVTQVSGGGTIAGKILYNDITSGKAFNFPEPALNQKNCDFAPHVLLMQPGTLKVLSSDAASHNIHVFSSANREVNQVMPPQGSPVEVTLARPDQVKILCEIHKWMSAYIFVVKNPYYVLSGIGGAFALSDVPAGKYHVKVWQESLGTQTQEVTVETGKMVTINFNLGSK